MWKLAQEHHAAIILLQEMCHKSLAGLKIPQYQLAAHTASRKHDIVTFIRHGTPWVVLSMCLPESEIQWHAVEVEGTTYVNVYKPPPTPLELLSLPLFSPPCLYAGDLIVATQTGDTIPPIKMETTWPSGHPQTPCHSSTTQRTLTVSHLDGGTLEATRT